jgi:hypothetical protein
MSRSLFQAKLWAQLRQEFLHKKVIKVLRDLTKEGIVDITIVIQLLTGVMYLSHTESSNLF